MARLSRCRDSVDLDENRLQNADIPALMRRCMGREVDYTIEHKDLWERKRTVADRFYKWFARNRYRLGCGEHCQFRSPDADFRES